MCKEHSNLFEGYEDDCDECGRQLNVTHDMVEVISRFKYGDLTERELIKTMKDYLIGVPAPWGGTPCGVDDGGDDVGIN